MSDERSALNGLPFRVMRDGSRAFLEYVGDFGGGLRNTCWLQDHEPAFYPICHMMEQYRALEQKLRDAERERDEAREETKKRDAVIAHKDKSLAGYEAQLSRYRKKAEQQ